MARLTTMGPSGHRTGHPRIIAAMNSLLLFAGGALGGGGINSSRKIILHAATPHLTPQPHNSLCFGTVECRQVSTHHISGNYPPALCRTVKNTYHGSCSTKSTRILARLGTGRRGCPVERYTQSHRAVNRFYSGGGSFVDNDTRTEQGSGEIRSLLRKTGRRGSSLGVKMVGSKSTEANDDDRRSHGNMHASHGLGSSEAMAPEASGVREVPRHVAFIMDGNGRWAKKKNLARSVGHVEGVRRAEEVVEACRAFGVEFVTLYVFSTENWKRPAAEVSFIMELLEDALQKTRDKMRRCGVRFTSIGEINSLPHGLRTIVQKLKRDIPIEAGAARSMILDDVACMQDRGGGTADGLPGDVVMKATNGETMTRVGQPLPATMTLCLALSYGGRTEVTAAARELATEVAAGKLDPSEINEETFERRLTTARLGIPDPDLVIRTSGESRLSNLLLWQTAYSELYIVNTMWPEFGRRDLLEAFGAFAKRKRKFGKTEEQMATR